MKMKIKSVPGFAYAVSVPEFPVDIEISTEVPTEIYSRVVVTGALLTKAGDEQPSLGYCQSVMPWKRQLVAFLPDEPLRMRVDVLEGSDALEYYSSGPYRCDISVAVDEKVGDRMRIVELSESLDVMVG